MTQDLEALQDLELTEALVELDLLEGLDLLELEDMELEDLLVELEELEDHHTDLTCLLDLEIGVPKVPVALEELEHTVQDRTWEAQEAREAPIRTIEVFLETNLDPTVDMVPMVLEVLPVVSAEVELEELEDMALDHQVLDHLVQEELVLVDMELDHLVLDHLEHLVEATVKEAEVLVVLDLVSVRVLALVLDHLDLDQAVLEVSAQEEQEDMVQDPLVPLVSDLVSEEATVLSR